MSPSLVRPSLHHEVAGKIGSLIAQGSIAPGAVLPNEAALGGEFGVSRTALREVIKVLASKGLVEVRRKTGTRVRPHAEWNMLDPEVLSWLFSGTGIPPGLTDLMEVRKVVEPAAARMAALRATSEDLAEIRDAYLGMERATGDLPSSVESDLRFHLAVLEATHNVFMRPFGALIQAALRASFRLTSSNSALYRKTLTLHRAVVNAIEAGKGDEAEAAMLAVLSQTSKDIATQTKAAVGGQAGARSHKRSRRRSA
ncbi:MAG TPA: FadR/GntR family transcriptional regulator [Terracidiphilus sp.]|nr:FadR/GntR family transcriptional regulator [Terracidiphilus sp.]